EADIHTQQFTQQETVLLGGRSPAGRAAPESSQAGAPNAFSPRMHASIMFSQSDRVMAGSDLRDAQQLGDSAQQTMPPLTQSFMTQEYAYDSHHGAGLDDYIGGSQFTQDVQTQNFTQY
ncbi:hypothetical protein GGF47_004585, partial [Coemansia sp. RSA 2524]